MDDWTKLLTVIAALVGAIAWPTTVLIVMVLFRASIRAALAKIPQVIDRVKKASMAGVVFELERVADVASQDAQEKGGNVTPQQFEAAARIAVESQGIGVEALLVELDRLCLEYDALKRTVPSGSNRTRAMGRVITKMRALAPNVIDYLENYKGSNSAGSRLAAIAMMQMNPVVADLDWLRARFSKEQPFVFYHAALALQSVADYGRNADSKVRVLSVARAALADVEAFDGVPDEETVDVLKALIDSLDQAIPARP